MKHALTMRPETGMTTDDFGGLLSAPSPVNAAAALASRLSLVTTPAAVILLRAKCERNWKEGGQGSKDDASASQCTARRTRTPEGARLTRENDGVSARGKRRERTALRCLLLTQMVWDV